MSICQVWVHESNIWCSPSRGFSKIDQILKELPDVCGNNDDILIAGYDADGKDHNRTLNPLMQV